MTHKLWGWYFINGLGPIEHHFLGVWLSLSWLIFFFDFAVHFLIIGSIVWLNSESESSDQLLQQFTKSGRQKSRLCWSTNKVSTQDSSNASEHQSLNIRVWTSESELESESKFWCESHGRMVEGNALHNRLNACRLAATAHCSTDRLT